MKSKNEILDRIYNLSGEPDECVGAYKDWAGTYDEDTLEGMNYVGPRVAAAHLAKLLKPSAMVLDAGCGTGLVGVDLADLGFKTIDGLDISAEMLAQANKKGRYRNLQIEDMTQTLSYATAAYDAVICVGTFTHAHVGPKGFNELIRVTKSGGLLVATVHEEVWSDGYEEHFYELESEGIASVKSISEEAYHINSCKLVTLEVA
jgi:predicted TPR repeat methyltransferase